MNSTHDISGTGPRPPRVVAVPPNFAARDMCVLPGGEIRHYGWRNVDGERRRVFISSCDNGENWRTEYAADGDCGAMVKSPWSGEWLYFRMTDTGQTELLRSKIGPGDTEAEVVKMPWGWHELRQLIAMRSRKRWIAAFSDVRRLRDNCYNAAVAYSDDDGMTWTHVEIPVVKDVPRMHHGDKRPHWFNNGCEPSVVELGDGRLLLALRTSGEHHAFCESSDGGETWSEPRESDVFWAANTMPYFFRLEDGRLLFIWNNTAMLPTRALEEYPELGDSEREGVWEVVFTNRDALHCAISEDDGKTWRGFREIALNDTRNNPDFRELGRDEEHDKSVHQTQAVELPGGRILLAYGQNSASRRLAIIDVDWLLETSREEDFRDGLHNVSNHLYLKSLAGSWRGWSGHCAFNRMPGAVMARDPDTDGPAGSNREVLQLCRICDPRLVSDRQGVVWNFPAARKGRLEIECRIEGAGFQLTLADHWMNPCDETGPARSPLCVPLTQSEVPNGAWRNLVVKWDCDMSAFSIDVDGKRIREGSLKSSPRFGLSYLHLQTLAEGTDARGVYFKGFRMIS